MSFYRRRFRNAIVVLFHNPHTPSIATPYLVSPNPSPRLLMEAHHLPVSASHLQLPAMEDQHDLPHHYVHDLDSLWPFLPFQPHDHDQQLPSSSSTHLLSSSVAAPMEAGDDKDEPEEELGAMKEMMYKIAAMQPVDIDPSTIRKPKRRNVRISDDPQSIAARLRRERISEKIRILQRLIPGGTKMDTASMLDEAIRYAKFLKRQIRLLQSSQQQQQQPSTGGGGAAAAGGWPFTFHKANGSTSSSTSMEAPAITPPGCYRSRKSSSYSLEKRTEPQLCSRLRSFSCSY